jgi:tRNA nucleotidyltransferase (CCA-adding enzyme)
MQVYLVGGAVRDELLGLPVGERDWVVVGATPAQMEQLGYRAVGRDFPVYLHPDTHEEYALARLERKVAPGYRGFTTQFSPEVSLEEDLRRRDLTINAMARAADGTLIDPYGGRQDLERRRLRHVSAAFTEDPVRILRVARFAARFAGLGFTVAPETGALMQSMVAAGEVRALVPERIWRELERALGESHPEAFFRVLENCGALTELLPALQWNAAVMAALQAAVQLSPDTDIRFAALFATTAPEKVQALCGRLHVPNEHRELAVLTAKLAPRIAAIASAPQPAAARCLLEWLEAADAFRRAARFARLLQVLTACAAPPGCLAQLAAAHRAAAGVALTADELGLAGPEIAGRLRTRRLQAIGAPS